MCFWYSDRAPMLIVVCMCWTIRPVFSPSNPHLLSPPHRTTYHWISLPPTWGTLTAAEHSHIICGSSRIDVYTVIYKATVCTIMSPPLAIKDFPCTWWLLYESDPMPIYVSSHHHAPLLSSHQCAWVALLLPLHHVHIRCTPVASAWCALASPSRNKNHCHRPPFDGKVVTWFALLSGSA